MFVLGMGLVVLGIVVGQTSVFGLPIAFLGGVGSFTGITIGAVHFMPGILGWSAPFSDRALPLSSHLATRCATRSGAPGPRIGLVIGIALVTTLTVASQTFESLIKSAQAGSATTVCWRDDRVVGDPSHIRWPHRILHRHRGGRRSEQLVAERRSALKGTWAAPSARVQQWAGSDDDSGRERPDDCGSNRCRAAARPVLRLGWCPIVAGECQQEVRGCRFRSPFRSMALRAGYSRRGASLLSTRFDHADSQGIAGLAR